LLEALAGLRRPEGAFGAAELGGFMPEAGRLQSQSAVPLYWVMDLRAAETNFAEIIKMLGQQSRPQTGTVANAPNRVFLVAHAALIRLFQNAMSQPQYGSLSIPIFPVLEDALAAVRIRRTQENQ
ncbi:MAG: hypothetical protein ABI835_17380, partial [Chloroflexota bacterium]